MTTTMLNTASWPQVLHVVCSLSPQILEYSCSEMFLLPSCSPYSFAYSVHFFTSQCTGSAGQSEHSELFGGRDFVEISTFQTDGE